MNVIPQRGIFSSTSAQQKGGAIGFAASICDRHQFGLRLAGDGHIHRA
jgi:hypothetical protein